jgi:hypothetical protein
MIGRGFWALTQPWGNTSQKVLGIVFFFLLFLFSLYLLIQDWLALESPWRSERFRNLLFAMAGLTFVFGGLVVFAVGHGTDRIWAIFGIVFFGLGTVHFLRRLS